MKTWLLSIVICLYGLSSYAQGVDQFPYRVVIGAFSVFDNAVRFSGKAEKKGFSARYDRNPNNNLYYVYVLVTPDREKAMNFALKLRAGDYPDCWVYIGPIGSNTVPFAQSYDQNPVNRQPINVQPIDVPATPVTPPVTTEVVTTTPSPTEEAAPPVTVPEPELQPQVEAAKETPSGQKKFVFQLISSVSGNPVEGHVRLEESDKSLKYFSFDSNKPVTVIPPKNKSGRYVIVCHIVGYKEFKTAFDYANPQSFDGAKVNGNEFTLPLKLQRVKKSDYLELDSTFFHNNSAIFMPKSKRQLDELVHMMNENPNYQIKIHGHVNGKESREMIKKTAGQDLFTLDESSQREKVSAKEFSKARAESVKEYLVSMGIKESRVDVIGDGGLYNIHRGSKAIYNNRIEVEVTKS